MISLKELNPHNYPVSEEIANNLAILLTRLNAVRSSFNRPMTITSGLRSIEQQEGLIKAGISKATKSLHLSGKAADIYDPDGIFYNWCLVNKPILEQIGLWCENRQGPWQHLQIESPKSGRRWFNP